MEPIRLIPTLAILAAFIPNATFVLLFSRVDWKKSPASQAIMLLAFVTMVTLALALGRQLGYPPPDWVRGPLYSLIAVAMWFLLIMFFVVQRRGRRRDEKRLIDRHEAENELSV
jgi:hypothetical protein